MTSLVNIYHKIPYDVYIGRAGKGLDGYCGNPCPLKKSGLNKQGYPVATEDDRIECITDYRKYFYKRIAEDPEFKARIDALKGKVLACFCFPKMCHGMVIIEYLEGIPVEQQIIDANPTDNGNLATFSRSMFD